MEVLLFSIVLAWGLVRYSVTDLVATAKGTQSPRYRERKQRLKQEHERRMARMQAGPTLGQAVAGRIAQRIATPKQPQEHTGSGPARRFFSQVWEQSWNNATDRVHNHRDRKAAGSLPRQKAARATHSAFDRWRHRRHDGRANAETSTRPTNSGPAPEGPVQAVAEVLPQGDTPSDTDTDTEPLSDFDFDASPRDDAQAGVAAANGTVTTWPTTDTDEEHNDMDTQESQITQPATDTEGTSSMNGAHEPLVGDSAEPITGEVTNISSAMTYTAAMSEQFTSAVTHADALSAHTEQMAAWARDAAASAETSLAGITAGEVSGEAVTSLEAAREQMTQAAARVAEAEQVFTNAREQFAQTAAAFDKAHSAFQRQSQVAEAYAVNPDAGSKQFNTIA